ncbi:MAG: hypothetical protein WCK04_05435 [Actinomycetes bacterium]
MKRVLTVSVGAVSLLCLTGALGACSSNSADPVSAPTTEMSSDSGSSQLEETGSIGAATYTVSQDVQDTYFKAICTGSVMKLGIGGSFDDATRTCTDASGVKTTQTRGLAGLLSSTPDEMRSSIQFMIVQMGDPVAGCPTADEFNTVVDLTITNTCVVNAMKAMSVFMTAE